MPDLGIQNIQFVLFKTDVAGERASTLYSKFVATEPDSTQTNRSPSPAAPHLTTASGVHAERFCNVQVMPGRVDFFVTHPDRPQSGPWAWKLEEGITILEESAGSLAERVLPTFGRTVRVAVIVTLLRNCPSQTEANATILERVGIEALAGAMDIAVQFSRRSPSVVKGFTLNRLLRFATSTSRELLVSADGMAQSFASHERHLATLQVDLNTVPTGVEIDRNTAETILLDMVGRARTIARNGTIRALEEDDVQAKAANP